MLTVKLTKCFGMYGVFDNHEERVSVQTPGKTCIYQHVCALKFLYY